MLDGYRQRQVEDTGLLVCRSMDAFMAYCGRILPRYQEPYDQWSGGGFQQAMNKLRRGGTPEQQTPIRKLMEKIDARVSDRQRREYTRAPAGAFPVVAEVLQGDPMHMRRRRHVESDVAPIKIVCEVGVSAGVDHAAIAARGAAIGALAMRLGEVRPVELWAFDGSQLISMGRQDNVTFMVKLDTNPLSVSQIAAVFVEVGFARAIAFSVAQQAGQHKYNQGIGFVWSMKPDNSPLRMEMLRILTGMTEEDIFIPGGYLSQSNWFMRDPVGWIESYLQPQRELE